MKHLVIIATILLSIFTAQAQTAEDIQQIQIEAQSGDSDALMRLGMLYQLGRGVEQNMEKGFEYIMQAAVQGNPDAISLLSMCYFNGWGTKKDTSKAVQVLNTLKEGMPPSIQQEIDNTIATINEGDTLSAYEFQFRLLPIIHDYCFQTAAFFKYIIIDSRYALWNLDFRQRRTTAKSRTIDGFYIDANLHICQRRAT